jgi:hypothetical protein
MEVNSIGVVTPGCKDCKMLKKRMKSTFSHHGINLVFVEVDYTDDEDQAMEICEKYGFDDIPAFEVAGVVFKKGFPLESVVKAVSIIEN